MTSQSAVDPAAPAGTRVPIAEQIAIVERLSNNSIADREPREVVVFLRSADLRALQAAAATLKLVEMHIGEIRRIVSGGK